MSRGIEGPTSAPIRERLQFSSEANNAQSRVITAARSVGCICDNSDVPLFVNSCTYRAVAGTRTSTNAKRLINAYDNWNRLALSKVFIVPIMRQSFIRNIGCSNSSSTDDPGGNNTIGLSSTLKGNRTRLPENNVNNSPKALSMSARLSSSITNHRPVLTLSTKTFSENVR